MYKIKEHKEEIITNVLSNLIQYIIVGIISGIGLIVPFVANMIKSLTNKNYRITYLSIILACVGLIILISIIILLLIYSISLNKKSKFNEYIVGDDFRFNKLEIELYFKSRTEIISNMNYLCTVTKDNIEKFSKEIIWTGDKYNYTKLVSSNGNYSIIDSKRENSPHRYTVNFDTIKNTNDIVEFNLQTSVSDINKTMSPVFSHMIKHQTDKLIIKLTVPPNLIKNVKRTTYGDIARDIPIKCNNSVKKDKIGNLISYSYEVENPNIFYNYCIEWNFKNDN